MKFEELKFSEILEEEELGEEALEELSNNKGGEDDGDEVHE